jgi:antitoxin HicB
MNVRYPAVFTPQEGGGFLVQFVDLENAVTEGATMEEARFNAAEVLTLILDDRIESGEPIPSPSDHVTDATYIAPDVTAQSAILLRVARGDRPLSDLARALETSWAAAQRLEDPNHWPSLKQLDRAARVLGKRLVLSLE